MATAARALVDIEDSAFDPFVADSDVFGDTLDPYPKFAAMLEEGPVHHVPYRPLFGGHPDVSLQTFDQYTVLGYEAVQFVLANPRLFTNEAFQYNLQKSFGRTITAMDPPDHPRFRGIFQKAFLPNVIRKWGEEIVQGVIDDLMQRFDGRKRADLVSEFTILYPFHIIYRQLDLPAEDVQTFHKLAVMLGLYLVDMVHAVQASENLGVYFRRLITEKRANPDSGMVSLLATAEVGGERIPDEVLVSFLRQLVNAAGDTTYRGTSILLTCLLRHPDQLAAVAADRTLVPLAIDEALRWDGPVTATVRLASEDCSIAGTRIPAGAVINVVLGSANRDPRRYADPDKFDIFRKDRQPHLAFATGPHVCIGQHLARLEMTRALNTILDRLHNLHLDPDAPAPQIEGFMMRVPRHLNVQFD